MLSGLRLDVLLESVNIPQKRLRIQIHPLALVVWFVTLETILPAIYICTESRHFTEAKFMSGVVEVINDTFIYVCETILSR